MTANPDWELATDAIAVIRRALDQGPDFELPHRSILDAVDTLERLLPPTRLGHTIRQAVNYEDAERRWNACSRALEGLALAVEGMRTGWVPKG